MGGISHRASHIPTSIKISHSLLPFPTHSFIHSCTVSSMSSIISISISSFFPLAICLPHPLQFARLLSYHQNVRPRPHPKIHLRCLLSLSSATPLTSRPLFNRHRFCPVIPDSQPCSKQQFLKQRCRLLASRRRIEPRPKYERVHIRLYCILFLTNKQTSPQATLFAVLATRVVPTMRSLPFLPPSRENGCGTGAAFSSQCHGRRSR